MPEKPCFSLHWLHVLPHLIVHLFRNLNLAFFRMPDTPITLIAASFPWIPLIFTNADFMSLSDPLATRTMPVLP